MQRPTPSRRRTGTAMIEMILALPFLVFILLLLFYFGRGVVNVQHVQVADRYTAWQQAGGGPGLTGPPFDNQNTIHANSDILVNRVFFNGKASTLADDLSNQFPTDATNALLAAAQNSSPDAGSLLIQVIEQFPRGVSAAVAADLPSDFRLGRMLDPDAIKHEHSRLGNEWKFVNNWRQRQDDQSWEHYGSGPWMLYPARDAFFTTIENELKPLSDAGNSLADFTRGLYTARPGYGGPTVRIPN